MIKLTRKVNEGYFQFCLNKLIPFYFSSPFSNHFRMMNTETEDSTIVLIKNIFLNGIQAVLPRNLIKNNISKDGDFLRITGNQIINLNEYKQIAIVGFGKAVLPMGEELLTILDQKINKCILSVPIGTRKPNDSRIECFPGAKNNIPDSESFSSCRRILDLTSSLPFPSLLFILISGGGSALFPYPIEPMSLDEKIYIIRELSKGGANIHELNDVRKNLSRVKGGKYLDYIGNNTGIGIILSDVPGNNLEIIASGPTAHYHKTEDPLNIIKKYIPMDKIPQNVIKVLQIQQPSETASTKINDNVQNFLIGTNEIGLNGCAIRAIESNLVPIILTTELEGDASEIGKKLAEFCCLIVEYQRNGDKKSEIEKIGKCLRIDESKLSELISKLFDLKKRSLCLLIGGETTVTVKGSGRGGRNQELVLSAATHLSNVEKNGKYITILSGGTDGIDGPSTAAAGAIATAYTTKNIQDKDPYYYLQNNDSYNYFKGSKYHILTGHTETNVMDIIVAIIKPATQHSHL